MRLNLVGGIVAAVIIVALIALFAYHYAFQKLIH